LYEQTKKLTVKRKQNTIIARKGDIGVERNKVTIKTTTLVLQKKFRQTMKYNRVEGSKILDAK